MKRQFLPYIIFKLTVLLFTFGISLSSCEDFLDQKPTDGLVLEEYWKNKEEVLSTLGGAYQLFSELDYLLFIHGELRGDMLQPNGTRTGASERAVMSANIETNQWFARWDRFYSTINICNHVIEFAPGVDDPTFTDYLKQQMVSEATFLRSLCYFYMVRIWQDVPFVTKPTTTDEGAFFPEKTSGQVILDSIKADLIDIRNRMPDHPTIEKSKSRATAGAVNALLASVYGILNMMIVLLTLKQLKTAERIFYCLLPSGFRITTRDFPWRIFLKFILTKQKDKETILPAEHIHQPVQVFTISEANMRRKY